MALLAADVQKRILERTGDYDPTTGDPVLGGGGYLEQQVANVWTEYADKAHISPRLQELFVERDLLERYIAALQHKFDFRDSDASFSRSQRIATLTGRRDKAQERINDLLAMVAANRAGAVGQLTTVAPVAAPFGALGLDANSQRYGGSPYYRRPWGYP